jgi:hypothetical protein
MRDAEQLRPVDGVERFDLLGVLLPIDEPELEARRARVDDEDVCAQDGQVQSMISGGSIPCSRV